MNTHFSHLETMAQRSYNNVSFSPERRGTQLVNDMSEELQNDIQELKKGGANEETITDYKARYERFFVSYIHAHSNCISSMITGGSKFPTNRAQKANRSEQRHWEVFREWRLRAKKAIVRKAQPAKTFVSELERYQAELNGMQRYHELMKNCNSIIKKSKGKDCTYLLVEAGLNESNARKIQLPDYAGRIGFASFNLTNNNANMKRIEGKIKELQAKESMREKSPITKYSFEGGEMIINYEIDRIQIFFATRPTSQELNEWKQKGLNTFNWSPSAMAWQRKITANAMYCIKSMLTGITKQVA